MYKALARTLLVVIPVVLAAGATPPGRHLLARAQSVKQIIPQPDNWVPFSANVKRVTDNGTVYVGRFYRAADASTRTETGPSLDDVRVISIKSMPDQLLYLWVKQRNQWISHPMQLPPGGWRPVPRVLNDRVIATGERIEGFALMKIDDGQNRSHVESPQLNFFPLRMTELCKNATSGVVCGEWYSNILIGNPPADLFKVPAGEPIVASDVPGGLRKVR
jgi:hypothetical protein